MAVKAGRATWGLAAASRAGQLQTEDETGAPAVSGIDSAKEDDYASRCCTRIH